MSTSPGVRPGEIGPREAQELLGIGSCMFHELIKSGRLPGRLLDQRGTHRRWLVKRADCLRLQAEGFRKYKNRGANLNTTLWERYFGPVPDGYSPIFRDGNGKNITPDNLVLKAKKYLWRPEARGEKRRPVDKEVWKTWQLEKLRAEYATRLSEDLAKELGKTVSAVRGKARKMKLRKDMSTVRDQITARHGAREEIGTERYHEHTDIFYVKVADKGPLRVRWRPKHYLIWEKANGRPVPAAMRVLFKDGDRRNFAPENLVAMTRAEATAYCMLRHQALPESMRKAIKMTRKLACVAVNKLRGREPTDSAARKPQKLTRRSHGKTRWTPEMDAVLERDHAVRARQEIAAELGVTPNAVLQRARRLGLGPRSAQVVMAEARAKAHAAQQAVA